MIYNFFKAFLMVFLIASTAFVAAVAFGQGLPEVPDVDPFAQLLELIRNWRSMSPIAVGMGSVVLIVQVIKRYFTGFQYYRLTVTVLSVLYAVALYVDKNGMSWIDAIVAAFVTGGGAVAIYEAWKGINKVLKAYLS